MKRKPILIIMLLISLIIQSCRTIDSVDIVRLSPNPSKPVLTGNPVQDKVILSVMYYRMLLWTYNARYMVGEITVEEYEEKKETILNIISEIEKAVIDSNSLTFSFYVNYIGIYS